MIFLSERYQKALIWSVDLFFTLAEIAMNRGVLPMSGSWCLRNALKKLAVSSEVQSSRCLFPVEAGADAAPLPLEDTAGADADKVQPSFAGGESEDDRGELFRDPDLRFRYVVLDSVSTNSNYELQVR